jgi:hypothetical protein
MIWTAADHDGTFEIEVAARDSAGNLVIARAPFTMTSRVIGLQPVVNPITHPLVFLYSAPPARRKAA